MTERHNDLVRQWADADALDAWEAALWEELAAGHELSKASVKTRIAAERYALAKKYAIAPRAADHSDEVQP